MPESVARVRGGVPLSVAIYDSQGGPVASERVRDRDLAAAQAETWFEGHLRSGFPQAPLSAVNARLRPVLRARDGGRELSGAGRPCAGFDLETRNAAGVTTRCHFEIETFAPVAARMARQAMAEGVLEAGQPYLYDVRADAEDESTPLEPVQQLTAPAVLRAPLTPLLDRAEAVDVKPGDGDYPVFVLRTAYEKAERISRKGAASVPPVETGGLLAGTLCCCPDSGELFAVVSDVFEAAESEATTYSLTYSGKTWERIQTVVRARQSQPDTRTQRVLGQSHGHNFLPLEGAAPCEFCPHLAVCTRSTAFLSQDDRQWCRAVFSGEPWQLSQIFGQNARREAVNAFFGQKGGELVERGFHLIDDFGAADLAP